MDTDSRSCGCPPTAPARPSTGGIHHVFLTVKDLARSRPFYDALMPRLGYPGVSDYGAVVGWFGGGGSFADPDGIKLELVHIPS